MTVQLATTTRNARLDAIETDAGVSAKVFILTGTQPANCATAQSGTKLVEFDLASDWAANASGGSKNFSGTPLSATAVNTGTAGYWRLYKNDGTTCIMQGAIGSDMTIDNSSINNGQTVNITSWTITDGNA
jgi:hypothetical protein